MKTFKECPNCRGHVELDATGCVNCGTDFSQLPFLSERTILEEIFLLDRVDSKTKYPSMDLGLGYTFAGAGLMDLVLQKKLKIIDGRLDILDNNPVNDAYIDTVLDFIVQNKNLETLKETIQAFGFPDKVHMFRNLTLLKLERMGIINQWREKKGPFSFVNIEEINTGPRQEILNELEDIFLNEKEPDLHYKFLISLLRVSKIYMKVLSKAAKKAAKKQIDVIVMDEPIGEGVRKQYLKAKRHR